MTERDRVFDAFRNCITEPKCKDCPWTECETIGNGNIEIPRDLALAVMRELAAQEPRVMTRAEALAADYVYLEIKLHASLPCECCILAVDPDGGILPLHKGFCAYLDGEEYGETWRCWTQRPSEEQRRAELWQQSLT